ANRLLGRNRPVTVEHRGDAVLAHLLELGARFQHQRRALVVLDEEVRAGQRDAGGHRQGVVVEPAAQLRGLPVKRLLRLEIDGIEGAVDVQHVGPAVQHQRRAGRPAVHALAVGQQARFHRNALAFRLPVVARGPGEVEHVELAYAVAGQVDDVAQDDRRGPADVARLVGLALAIEHLAVAGAHDVAALTDKDRHARDPGRQHRAVIDADLFLLPADLPGLRVEADQLVLVDGQYAVRQGGGRRIAQVLRLDARDPLAFAIEVVAGGDAVAAPDPDLL